MDTKKLGNWLIILGIVGFVIAVIVSIFAYAGPADNGSIPAISFFFIMLGMAFYFPDLLQDESKSLSTMRVVVWITIMVFAIVAVRLSWQVKTFDEFKIDRTWVYILGLAFGSKVFQKFSEERESGGKGIAPKGKDT